MSIISAAVDAQARPVSVRRLEQLTIYTEEYAAFTLGKSVFIRGYGDVTWAKPGVVFELVCGDQASTAKVYDVACYPTLDLAVKSEAPMVATPPLKLVDKLAYLQRIVSLKAERQGICAIHIELCS